MRRMLCFWCSYFQKVTTHFLIISLLVLLSCKKDEIPIIESILGDYYTDDRGSCPNGATLLDSFSSFTIKKATTNPKSGIEIHFVSHRGAIWYGLVKEDSLIFDRQIVATTSTEYFKGGIEIKGFGVIKGSVINLQIEEHYLSTGIKQFCTFISTKK